MLLTALCAIADASRSASKTAALSLPSGRQRRRAIAAFGLSPAAYRRTVKKEPPPQNLWVEK
jgi:hypothetical protein